ncbi:hypothetical protein A8B73_16180 [Methylosinus sp. 3S-1]|nr:hypothetical protein A8B73_16180 [Methylosinus sp. 3S-1]
MDRVGEPMPRDFAQFGGSNENVAIHGHELDDIAVNEEVEIFRLLLGQRKRIGSARRSEVSARVGSLVHAARGLQASIMNSSRNGSATDEWPSMK